jgi:heme oxygenase (mycobilin-producing)
VATIETVPLQPDAAPPPVGDGVCPFRKTGGPAGSAGAMGSDTAATAGTFAALSKFAIANGMVAEVKAAFRNRPHLVDDAPGYRRMEVISPLDRPEEIWLLTFWADEASYRTWHHSHRYRESHRGIPKGLKLVPGETKISRFEHVAS